MTAAFGELTGPAARGRAGRFLCVLALVLPIPLVAALGLSLPLPSTVERIAAKLVPFGDADALDSQTLAVGARGSIALAPGERYGTDGDIAASAGSPAVHSGPRTSGKADLSATPSTGAGPRRDEEGAGDATPPTAGTERTTSPATPQLADAPSAAPSNGGGEEGSDPADAPPIVDTATNTANTAVETVNTTVADATSSVGDTTKEAVESVTDAGAGALGGIKPP